LVHNGIKDTHSQIGHTDLIGVREAEGYPKVDFLLVLYDLLVFASHISGRLLYIG
jgi:hypothetical protein